MRKELLTYLQKYPYKTKKQLLIFGKEINIPVVYPDASAVMILMTGSYNKIEKEIGFGQIKPVRIFGERAMIGLTLFDYREGDVGPYREFTITVPVVASSSCAPLFLPLIFESLFKDFGFFVTMLGASSEMAREHIRQIFPYPLYNKDIDVKIEEKEKNLSASLFEENKKILTVEGYNVLSSNYKFEEKIYNTYFRKDSKLSRVKLDTFSFIARTFMRNKIKVYLGKHPIVDYLKGFDLNPQPFSLVYYKNAIEIASQSEVI